jgi:plastocyanin
MNAEQRFDPAEVTVRVGQSIVWRNASRNPQTVTCDPRLAADPSHVMLPAGATPFDSGVINTNTPFTHTFDVPGTYQYVSLPFEDKDMIGRVNVQ